MKYAYVFLLSVLALSCATSEQGQTTCYAFDLKSCNADPWDGSETAEGEDNKIRSYLSDQGVTVKDIRIDSTFHEVVCLACEVCPEGPRVYISLSTEDEAALERLDLLSLQQSTICP